jgi:hypothetical protein
VIGEIYRRAFLAGGLMSTLLPTLAFGMLGFGGAFPDAPGATGGFTGPVCEGHVSARPGVPPSAGALSAAVSDAASGDLMGPQHCADVTSADRNTSVLCTGGGTDGEYAVVRFTDDAGGFEVMTFSYGAP